MRFGEEVEVPSAFSSLLEVHVREAVPLPARDVLPARTGALQRGVSQRNQTLPIALGTQRENVAVRDRRRTFER